MAIYDKRITGSNGINYTKEVDGPSDWSGIAYNTYFKDLSDGLIYWRNSGGVVIAIYELAGASSTYTTGTTVVGSTAYFDRTDSLSAYTLDLPSYVETTYTGLTSMMATSGLTVGTAYVFPYQTIHNIDTNTSTTIYNSQIDPSISLPAQTFTSSSTYDEGDNVKTTFTAEIEHLVAIAVSSSKINVEVYSQEYPNDIIHYDIGLEPSGPTTPGAYNRTTEDGVVLRPGFITFRHDTVRNVSAHFDWRNVLHRRYDMNKALDRSTEYDLFVKRLGDGFDFRLSYPGAIPAVVPFIDTSSDTNLGGLITAADGNFRDYKTISYYNLNNGFLHQNIHIDKTSNSVSKQSGSGFGAAIPTGQRPAQGTSIGNVVLFGRAITNVKIGTDPSGVHISAQLIKNVVIGNEVQNVLLGGEKGSNILLTSNAGYLDDIKIGDMSRDINISSNQNNIEIGNGNIGIWSNDTTSRIKVGNENKQVFIEACYNAEIGDVNVNTFIHLCFSLKIGTGNNETRLNNVGRIDSNIPWKYNSTNQLLTPGFINPINISLFPQYSANTAANCKIGDGNDNINLMSVDGLNIGGHCMNITVFAGTNLNIGNKSMKIDIYCCDNVTIGDQVQNYDSSFANLVNVGDSSTRIHILESNNVNIGRATNTLFLIHAGNDINIGAHCSYIYAREYANEFGLHVGDGCSNITARKFGNVNIGNEVDGVYMELAESVVIGDNNKNVVLAPLGIRYMLTFPTNNDGLGMNTYRFTSGISIMTRSPQISKYYDADVSPTPPYGNSILNGASGTVATAFPEVNLSSKTIKTKIGDNCNDIYVVSSTGTTIEDNCSNISVGTHQVYSIVTTPTYDATGTILPFDDTYVINNATFNGDSANDNSFEDNCSNIRVIGPSGAGLGTPKVYNYSGNHFGENVTGIHTATPYTLTDTSIMLRRRNNTTRVDLAPISPLTASYASKVFDRRSPDGEIWEQSINSIGTLQSPNKLL